MSKAGDIIDRVPQTNCASVRTIPKQKGYFFLSFVSKSGREGKQTFIRGSLTGRENSTIPYRSKQDTKDKSWPKTIRRQEVLVF